MLFFLIDFAEAMAKLVSLVSHFYLFRSRSLAHS